MVYLYEYVSWPSKRQCSTSYHRLYRPRGIFYWLSNPLAVPPYRLALIGTASATLPRVSPTISINVCGDETLFHVYICRTVAVVVWAHIWNFGFGFSELCPGLILTGMSAHGHVMSSSWSKGPDRGNASFIVGLSCCMRSIMRRHFPLPPWIDPRRWKKRSKENKVPALAFAAPSKIDFLFSTISTVEQRQ